MGFEYQVIIDFLDKYHGIYTCYYQHLSAALREFGLERYNQHQNRQSVMNLITSELNGVGCLGGYRSMWHTLRISHGIIVPRRKVQILMRELDPEGRELRHRRRLRWEEYNNPGPNISEQVDGYDKLKDFGLPIHSCIDGFSREI